MPFIQKIRKALKPTLSPKAMQRRNLVEPVRDWMIGLSCCVVLFVSGVVYVVFDFYTQVDVSYESVEVSVEAVSYPERDVVYYAEEYMKKEESFNQLREIRHDSVVETESDPLPLAEDLVAQ